MIVERRILAVETASIMAIGTQTQGSDRFFLTIAKRDNGKSTRQPAMMDMSIFFLELVYRTVFSNHVPSSVLFSMRLSDNISDNGCSRVQRFSNPLSLYQGKPIGSATEDNALHINGVKAEVEAYFDKFIECEINSDCDDGDVCTQDECFDGICLSNFDISLCPECLVDSDCNDGDSCTGDTCSGSYCFNTFDANSALCPVETMTTLFDENNGQAGNLFEIVAKEDLTIDRFHINTRSTDSIQCEVYTREGNYVVSSDGWTLVQKVTVTGKGSNNPTELPMLDQSVHVMAGTRQAFYITLTGPDQQLGYRNGNTEGAVYTENAHMQFLEGKGVPYPMSSSWAPRIWNGVIIYYLDVDEIPFPSSMPSSLPSLSTLPSSEPSTSTTPSSMPSSYPSLSLSPSSQPSTSPSGSPAPTSQPSAEPSHSTMPSSIPSSRPSVSNSPTMYGSTNPTLSLQPTSTPSTSPSYMPSKSPAPSDAPSSTPTSSPSDVPSYNPSEMPSSEPSLSSQPSSTPSTAPSLSQKPSSPPSSNPTSHPSTEPSENPSNKPSSKPSNQPSKEPSVRPSIGPSDMPSSQPSGIPSISTFPTVAPTINPVQTKVTKNRARERRMRGPTH
jgi:hypothetical protein